MNTSWNNSRRNSCSFHSTSIVCMQHKTDKMATVNRIMVSLLVSCLPLRPLSPALLPSVSSSGSKFRDRKHQNKSNMQLSLSHNPFRASPLFNGAFKWLLSNCKVWETSRKNIMFTTHLPPGSHQSFCKCMTWSGPTKAIRRLWIMEGRQFAQHGHVVGHIQ